jgi:hypothetical protein
MNWPKLEIRRFEDEYAEKIQLCDITNEYLLDEWKLYSPKDMEEFREDMRILGFNLPQ